MEGRYEPQKIEEKWCRIWERERYFSPSQDKKKPSFSMVMPPPNITGALHMGHAFNNTLQDIVVRFKRMQGYRVLWVPGTDHAGIATQNVVEKELQKEGKNRKSIGREKFIKLVWEWKKKYGETIVRQLKSLGVSCSWEDKVFTLDKEHSEAVKEVFVRLYREGYIYQGDYIINWCPRCETALSDIEVEYRNREAKLYYIRYPSPEGEGLVVATSRPETMLGDTGVAVNPEDERYKKFIGKTLVLPLIGRKLPVIGDEYVDPSFGTGVLKVTPAHDPDDFLLGKKHGLPSLNVLNPDGTINEKGGPYQRLDRFQARKKILEDLKKEGFLVKIEDYPTRIGFCYRCEAPIEPYLSRQWFVRTEKLAEKAIKVVREGKIKFAPSFWKEHYFRWLKGIRDWCISRQIWWGHRIPAWTCEICGELVVEVNPPSKCPQCGDTRLKQDEDVLDTWFSSSLWPFTTLGWPKEREKFKSFYPTSLLVSGWDILFFWVARMIMMGLKFTQKVPFLQVYIHPLVGDEKGQKMSKSKGNVIDPLEIMEKYGTDAFRFSLVSFETIAPYMRFSEGRVRGYRDFCNKIWNASRFVFLSLSDFSPSPSPPPPKELADRWILSLYHRLVKKVTRDLENYRFPSAGKAIYDFFWGEFCDWYVELVKPRLKGEDRDLREGAQWCLWQVLKGSLKLLHPFMPFITEEIYQRLPGEKKSIMVSAWPEEGPEDPEAEEKMEIIKKVIQEARALRSEFRVPPQKKVEVLVKVEEKEKRKLLEKELPLIKTLVKAKKVTIGKDLKRPPTSCAGVLSFGEIFIPLGEFIQPEKEKVRLRKEIENIEKRLSLAEKKLSRDEFLQRAPQKVIEKERELAEELRKKKERLLHWLKGL